MTIYTDADKTRLARQLAHEAVYIGTGPAADSYINFDKVIDAAKRTGTDAIHPGLSRSLENRSTTIITAIPLPWRVRWCPC